METRDPTRMKAANKLRIIVADDHDIVRKGLCYLLARRKEVVSIEDSSEVPQVWRLRSEGSWTSHNGSSVNFLGDGTIFWGDGTDGLSFVERSTELRDWPIVGGMREMVKLDGESVGFRIGQQVDWSLTPESDAQWRVYSTVVKDPKTGRNTAAEQEGVKVRTTQRTLLSLLWAAS